MENVNDVYIHRPVLVVRLDKLYARRKKIIKKKRVCFVIIMVSCVA